jgi:hypothetical protein
MVGTLSGLLTLALLGMIAVGDRPIHVLRPEARPFARQAPPGPAWLLSSSHGDPPESPRRKIREYLDDDDRDDEGPSHSREGEAFFVSVLPTREPPTLLYAKRHRVPIAAGLTSAPLLDTLGLLLI